MLLSVHCRTLVRLTMPSPPRCVGGTPECSVHNENVNGSMEQHNGITTIVELCKGSEDLFSFFSHLGCRAMLCTVPFNG